MKQIAMYDKTKKYSPSIALFVLLLGSFSSAQALTATFTDNWSTNKTYSSNSTVTGIQYDHLNDTDGLSISLFDPALGILNSVRVIYENIRFDNSASATFRDADRISTTEGRQLLATSLTIDFAGIIYKKSALLRDVSCKDSSISSGGATCSTSLLSQPGSFSSLSRLLTDSSDLSLFTGNGNRTGFAFQEGLLTTQETDGDDGFIAKRRGNVNTSGTLKVIYDYDEYPPVPLPAAFWLFASALSGMFCFRNRN